MSIRNFCIIAHIDHGKSTLADRLLEMTNAVPRHKRHAQMLDSMELERERGITIKLQPARMNWRGHEYNLIDTPGHIDFTYEVSRSLEAVEGALLLVDATQGVQAQTITNLNLAKARGLSIIPILNKIDLNAANVTDTAREVCVLLKCKEEDILQISAKTGQNVESVLDAIIERIPEPRAIKNDNEPLQALIFDAEFDEYKGVVVYIRVVSGSVSTNDRIQLIQGASQTQVLECGYFSPQLTKTDTLHAGQIGYIITSLKTIEATRVGDTVALSSKPTPALPGYNEPAPMVFASIYPSEHHTYEQLKKAVYKLKLNDASLSLEQERSEVLGHGFRCGFLGVLHIEIFSERLKREFDVECIMTAPTISYSVKKRSGELITVTSPADFPDHGSIESVSQPVVTLQLVTPVTFMGALMEYLGKNKANYIQTDYIDTSRVIITYLIPLARIVTEFYNVVKKVSSGYASYTYELTGTEVCELQKLDVYVAEEKVPGLSILVESHDTFSTARRIVKVLAATIPRHQFVVKIQASVGSKIIASERISAMRKDVTAPLYGGDVTRKKKLLQRQKRGKQRLLGVGKVQIPASAYRALSTNAQ